jgi:Tfp pilus assembly protein PilZ
MHGTTMKFLHSYSVERNLDLVKRFIELKREFRLGEDVMLLITLQSAPCSPMKMSSQVNGCIRQTSSESIPRTEEGLQHHWFRNCSLN